MSGIKKALEKAKALRMAQVLQADNREEENGFGEHAPKIADHQTWVKTVEVSGEHFLKNRIVALDDEDPASDQFKLLRTKVFRHTRRRHWKMLQVTGFGPGEGKSLLAVNLAVSIAKDSRQSAVLVDLDLRRPSIHRLLGLGRESFGLRSYLRGEVRLEEALICPGIPKLRVLTAGGRLFHSAELLGSSKMESLLRELKRRYEDEYIILDTPGINVCPDPLIISEYVDAILLVARAGHSLKANIKAAMEIIPKDKILGTVLNDAPAEDVAPYGYSQQYGYQWIGDDNTLDVTVPGGEPS